MSNHHSDDSQTVALDSSYPILQPPGEFHSQIPEHLLVDTSPTERYIMEQISIVRQHMDWSVQAHLSTDRNVRKTNGRLLRVEAEVTHIKEDKKLLKSGWKVLVIIGGAITGFASFLALLWQTFGSK